MAKALNARTWINRAIEAGRETVKSIAAKLGRAPSTISAIRSGKRPGENLREAARDLAKGKRAPVAAPPVRHAKPKAPPAPPPKPAVLTPLEKAERQLDKLDGTDRIVVHLTSMKTGRSRTLFAKGGANAGDLFGDLRGLLEKQAARQGNNSSVSDPEIHWDDVAEIEFEEYY